MYDPQPVAQLQTIFGNGYVPEHHSDQTHGYLPCSEVRESVVAFSQLLKALRAALSLSQH